MTPQPGHGHGHHHDDIDWNAMAEHLEREAELRVPAIEEALAWLRGLLPGGGTLRGGEGPSGGASPGGGSPGGGSPGGASPGGASPSGVRVLDIGSGPGVLTVCLARAFPEAETVAVDGEPALLDRARARADRENVAVTTLEAQFPDELGQSGSADLIWTSNVIHHVGDQQAALDSLAGVLRPGGVLAVAERGLSPRYLPRDIGLGRPGLLARLEAANEDRFESMREALPGHVRTVEDWPAMLARAGLLPVAPRTFLTDVPAPLGPEARRYLHDRLGRARETLAESLSEDDLASLDALLDEDAPTGVMRRGDAFLLTATTVHAARRP